ncbi:2804_t:CDS:2, partial [Rhizophagus irregularis]
EHLLEAEWTSGNERKTLEGTLLGLNRRRGYFFETKQTPREMQ